MSKYKHYIKIDEFNNVIDAFSSAFKEPDNDSILINDKGDRHFNPEIFHFYTDTISIYKNKYIDNQFVEKTEVEINNEIDNILGTNEIKQTKVKKIRIQLLNMTNWINDVWIAQEHGFSKGINKKQDRLLSEALYDAWSIWFEDMSTLLNDIDLSGYTYDEITINNTNIFPVMPDFPGDILTLI